MSLRILCVVPLTVFCVETKSPCLACFLLPHKLTLPFLPLATKPSSYFYLYLSQSFCKMSRLLQRANARRSGHCRPPHSHYCSEAPVILSHFHCHSFMFFKPSYTLFISRHHKFSQAPDLAKTTHDFDTTSTALQEGAWDLVGHT